MKFSQSLIRLRARKGLAREALAEALRVSSHEIEQWEKGDAAPDAEQLPRLADILGTAAQALTGEGAPEDAPAPLPAYGKMHNWENYSSELMVEYRQSMDEGRDIEEYKPLFEAVSHMKPGAPKAKMGDILFSIVQAAKTRDDYPYVEPDDLSAIRALRPYCPPASAPAAPDRAELLDHIYGAWLGRVCGCLLGKPIEGIRTDELLPLLQKSGNWPMKRYIHSADISQEMIARYRFPLKGRCYADTVTVAPVDDDTNYVVLAQVLLQKCGRNFTPADAARIWLDYQPKNAYCTAERVAYCNFVKGFQPPDSASFQNPYREWIGAQIRADYFGYINPGNPEMAAEMAWRDASISHVKNGIYGEMFVAAMIARAAVARDIEEIILAGLGQIPETSRLYRAVSDTLRDYHSGVSEADAFARIHADWDEHSGHDWCHTISNARIVAAALLYGGGDYGKSICLAVQTGFDTDCNGATVGSILGMRGGARAVDACWSDPISGQLDTSIFGVGRVNLMDMAKNTLPHLA